MKKFITLLLVLTGMVCTAGAVNNKTVYFKPSSADPCNWASGARFALYRFNAETSGWDDFTQVGETGIYKVTIDIDTWTKMIICRMNGGSTENNWNNTWNQSGDLDAPTSSIYYDKSSNTDWDKWNGSSSNVTTREIYDQMTVEGSRHLTNGYAEWNAAAANETEMVNGVNTLVVSGKALKAGTYDYKYYCGNDTWIPSGDNKTLTIATDGVYDIKFTYNQFTQVESAVAEKQDGDNTVEYKYFVFEPETSVTGNSYLSNEMTVSDSKATLTVNNASLNKGTQYQFKIVERVYLNGEYVEGSEYWSYNPSTGNMWSITPRQSTTCNFTFIYDVPTTYTYTSDNVYTNLTPVADSWYFIVGDNSGWTIGDKLTETSSGVFTGTVYDWNGKMFAITPSSAITGTSTIDWSQVVRPNNESDDWITFPWVYSNQGTTNDNNEKVWHLWVNANNGSIDFTYNSTNNTWSSTPFVPLTVSNGFATFSYPDANVWGHITIPEGITAYYATDAKPGSVTMTAIESNEFPLNEAVFLKAENTTEEYKFYGGSSWDDSSDKSNLLVKGTADGVPATGTDDKYNYVFALQNDELGFYNVASAITANMTGKAYLQYHESLKPSGLARIAIVFDDEETTTGISAALNDKGEMTNEKSVYNLSGQRVANPTKGLYIVNGKKVIIK